MQIPEKPNAAGATPVTTHGGSSTPRVPAAPFALFQVPPQPTRRTQSIPSGHQQSPQFHPNPSTAATSPPPVSAPSPAIHEGHVNINALQPQSALRENVRAQIACGVCRRSKTKCKNQGIDTVCDSCRKANKECRYESGPGPRTPQTRENMEGNVNPRPLKKPRPMMPRDPSHPHAFISIHDKDFPLTSLVLSQKVWKELLEIYDQHFAADFPFLHRIRFLRSVQSISRDQSSAAVSSSMSPPRSAHADAVLLGFLSLTARHHDEVVRSFQRKPKEVAEYFASHTQRLLEPILVPGAATLERVQALLFLGFHRWTDLKGATGYDYIGIAGRWAHRLKLHKLDKRDLVGTIHRPLSASSSAEDKLIDREIERRTYWSCFILDRYSGCLEDRPHSINADEIETQLPCSDAAFIDGSRVKTRHLLENDDQYLKRRETEEKNARPCEKFGSESGQLDWEVDKSESELVMYIRAVSHFGNVMNWANKGGRRQEKLDPWHPDCGFRKLEIQHDELKSALPARIALTSKNTETHALLQNSCTYVSIHAIHSLHAIVLYREYMAFAPWGRNGPTGPLDEPNLSGEPEDPEYWKKQARKCFGAARQYADLLRACQKAGSMTESPIVAWTTYTVAWCVVYAHYFETMDPNRVLSSDNHASWEFLVNILHPMINRYAMAGPNATSLIRLNRHYLEKRIEWRKEGGASPGSTRSDGGLRDYVNGGFERGHKGMGSPDDTNFDQNVDRAELTLGSGSETDGRSEATSPMTNFKHEETPASTPGSAGFHPMNRRQYPRARSEVSLPSVKQRLLELDDDTPETTLPPITNTISTVLAGCHTVNNPSGIHSEHSDLLYDRSQVRLYATNYTLAQTQPAHQQYTVRQEQMQQEGQRSWGVDDLQFVRHGGPQEACDPHYAATTAWVHNQGIYEPWESGYDYSALESSGVPHLDYSY